MATENKIKNKTCDFTLLKKGDKLSEIQFYQVIGIGYERIDIKNERGMPFSIARDIVEEGLYSSNQVLQVEEVSQTRIIEIFSQCWNTILTVNFMKKPNEKSVSDKLKGVSFETFSNSKLMKKLAQEITLGEERTLIGYLVKTENGFGRSEVIDLEIERDWSKEYDNRLRQVDHRTINWLIFKNVKYVVK
jgi:hypothetical protein